MENGRLEFEISVDLSFVRKIQGEAWCRLFDHLEGSNRELDQIKNINRVDDSDNKQ